MFLTDEAKRNAQRNALAAQAAAAQQAAIQNNPQSTKTNDAIVTVNPSAGANAPKPDTQIQIDGKVSDRLLMTYRV